MARDQRKRTLDQPARDSLAALNDALAAIGIGAEKPQQPDEFTIWQLADAAGVERRTMLDRLRPLIADNKVTRRKLGRAYIYRIPQPEKVDKTKSNRKSQ